MSSLTDTINDYNKIKYLAVDERTAYFNECWHQWDDHRLVIELSRTQVLYLRKYLRGLGLYEWQDYIFRHGKEIRFRTADDLAMVIMSELV